MKITSIFAAAALSVAATGASALTLDLTSLSQFTSPIPGSNTTTSASGSLGSVGWTLASSGGDLTYGSSITSPSGNNTLDPDERMSCLAELGLACDFDGIGITNDEDGPGQQITLTFKRAVKVEGLSFLDVYDPEAVEVEFDGNKFPLGGVSGTFPGNLAGAAFSTFAPTGVTKISFFGAGAPDDNNIDFALAAIEVQATGNEPDPVPLPAGGALLLGGLGGLSLLRRRKKTA